MRRLCALHQRGVTIVMITHDMQLVADYAERVAVLVGGRLRYTGTVDQLFGDEELLQSASLCPPPLHALARELGVGAPVGDGDGRFPLSIGDWYPFFGVDCDGGAQA